MTPSPQPAPRLAQSQASVLLDLLRGLAALLVLLSHWRNFLFVDFGQLSAASRRWMALPYLLTSTGHAAVVIFFVLSGYLIGASVFRMFARDAWSWKTYLTHRLVRLWVVLLPGLLLCALWDRVGLHAGLAPALYHGQGTNHMTPDVGQFLGLRVFLGNFFFLQTILTPVYGSDGALWSLANELWYYVLFALGMVALRSHGLLRRVLCGLGLLAVARLVGWEILGLFPIWLLGALLALLPVPKFSARLRGMASVAYAAVFFGLSRVHLPGLAQDYLLGALTFGLLWVLLSATQPARRSHFTRLSHLLAGFSYTLYVVHMPFLLLLTAYFAGDARWQATPAHLLQALGILALTLLYAWVAAWLTEHRTATVRRWVEARLGAR